MNEEWRKNAACLGSPTEWWYPAKREELTDDNKKAIEICETCKVKTACLQDSFDNAEYEGIRGGLVPWKRRKMKAEFKQLRRCRNCGQSYRSNTTLICMTCKEKR